MSDAKKSESFLQRLMLRLDEHTSVKLLLRLWGPRLEFFVRLMLVATFFDDSFRIATHFFEQTKQIGEQEYLKWLAETSPALVSIIATVVLGIGVIAQSLGSLCLLVLLRPDGASKALIGWTIAQPVLYGQLSNNEFVSESVSLIGGLLMLRAHLVSKPTLQGTCANTQLLGRMLLPAAYLYRAWNFLSTAFTFDETNNLVAYFSSLSEFGAYTAVFCGLVVCSILVATGLRSRFIALLLALVNLGCVCYQHPIFRYVWFEHGKWKVDEDNMSMPQVTLPADVSLGDFDAWQIFDLHRYYFFLGLSTSGALLLLTQFGPGDIALEKDETILPLVARAQD